ncbi:MAG: alginate export family protein [Steroidobacteraceae bacterium]
MTPSPPFVRALCCLPALFGAVSSVSAAEAAPKPWNLHDAVGAPANLQLSGSIRTRLETLSGQSRVGLDPRFNLVSLRSNVFAEYYQDWFRIGGELWDSRAYPQEPTSGVGSNDVNALEFVQAYVGADFGAPFGKGSSATAQLGRFVLNLGSRRVVAADDYRNTTNGYSGLRVDLKSAGGASATLIYTEPQVRLPDALPGVLRNDVKLDRESSDLVLWGGIAAVPKLLPFATIEGSWFGVRERDRPDLATRDRNLHTGGLRLFRDPKAGTVDFELEGIHQTGTVRASTAANAALLDVSASFYHVEAGYQWAAGSKPHLAFEYDYASGDDGDAKFGRFDTLFGMRRGDLAPSGLYNAIGRTNLQALGLRLEATPTARLDYMASYRALWLASRTDSFSTTGVRDATGRSGDFGGHQFDGRLRYWVIPRSLRFEVDAVILAKGRFLDRAPNAPQTGDTRFLSVNITSQF